MTCQIRIVIFIFLFIFKYRRASFDWINRMFCRALKLIYNCSLWMFLNECFTTGIKKLCKLRHNEVKKKVAKKKI